MYATADQATTLANAAQYGPMLRILHVANLDAYDNVTTPQKNLTVNIPWARVSAGNIGWWV